MIRYEGDVYRPPSEAYSLIIQATVGCTHNKCSFCKMFKQKRFHTRKTEEILAEFEWARKRYRSIPRIFLADANALCLKQDKLMPILTYIEENIPECERVTIYGRAGDVKRKTDEELEELRAHGLKMVYIGAESGSDKVLKDVNKGETRADLIEAVQRLEKSGIMASVTFISGLAGKDGWEEHAIETGTMITEMNASYVSLLTLLIDPGTKINERIQSGELKLLSAEEVLEEMHLILENAHPEKSCVFRSNHASNYVPLKGNIPEDNERMMKQLEDAIKDSGKRRDERFRLL